MRTTLDIDDDVLEAAKEMARIEHVSAGKIVTKLLRLAMSGALDGTA
ncbi:MAG TPA: CopG family transcriptional regulator, partial [Halieaceae bacterium]|nr:CopG family transcriptional regulator [Halieaceae bacterium]